MSRFAQKRELIEKRGTNSIFLRAFLAQFLVVALAFPSQALAGSGPKVHGHKTPHGGIVRNAEGINAEFLLDKDGNPKLYLYDETMKPLERGDLQVRLMMKGHDGSQHSRNLKVSSNPKRNPVYQGELIKGMSDWELAVVSIKKEGRWLHVRFCIIKRAILEAVKNYPLRNIAKVHIIVFGFAYPCAESSQGEVRLLTG